MLFCSRQFAVFFVVVFALHWAIPWRRVRVWLLLAASFCFYASWSGQLACVVFASAVGDYAIARGMDALSSQRWRKFLLGCSLTGNLGLLCYFKYANFFLQSLEGALHVLGATGSLPVLRVILPIGISFYTFEAINYTVDVYRRRIPAERNVDHFLLFILFFPHLVAGPIVRAADFLPQIRQRRHWDWLRLQVGLGWFAIGLFKKMVIAERMSLFVDPVFACPVHYHAGAVWAATIAYFLQVYCDFSGYSDMAIGAAHMLGYKLAVNFRMPFLAVNISDFWRRWHISLSTWLRDYLFIPLGGSRKGEWRTNVNLFLTMTLGGLWHGASWNLVIWGALHGLFLVVHRWFEGYCDGRPTLKRVLLSAPGVLLRIAATFMTVALSLVVFRTSNFWMAVRMFKRMLDPIAGFADAPVPLVSFWVLVGVIVLGHVLPCLPSWKKLVARAGAGDRVCLRGGGVPGRDAGPGSHQAVHLLPVLIGQRGLLQETTMPTFCHRLIRRGRWAVIWCLLVLLVCQVGLVVRQERSPERETLDPHFAARLERVRAPARPRLPGQPLLVALGSSRMAMSFRPSALPPMRPSSGQSPVFFNFAMLGSSLADESDCFHELLAHGVKPAWLVIEVWRPCAATTAIIRRSAGC